MPTYTYQCGACTHRFDAVQSIHDDALDACPECAGTLRKVFGSVGVTFKGSGFYRTDSRASARKASSSSAGKSSATASSSAKPSS
ncbi:MAG: FmdB family transcriptional regulator [Actinobacteria bacterium HGW-Actinobacteria-4]|nr:MAG: FmdB family transcriptional regulator [Actinobacteria bacterium HGW-Actinobacteria-4]